MEKTVSFKFLDTENVGDSFAIDVRESELNILTLEELLMKAKMKVEGFCFDGVYELTKEEVLTKKKRPVSYFQDLHTPFYYHVTDVDIESGESIFVDIENPKGFVEGKFSKTAPKWRICVNGLNLLADCSCGGKKKEVIVPYGYKPFDLNSFDKEEVVCPVCKNMVNPKSCLFSRCQYKIIGLKAGRPMPMKPILWKKVEKDFEYYDSSEKGSGTAGWMKMCIYSKRLDADTSTTCVRCNNYISDDSSIPAKDCQHKMHKKCVDAVGGLLECPVCRRA